MSQESTANENEVKNTKPQFIVATTTNSSKIPILMNKDKKPILKIMTERKFTNSNLECSTPIRQRNRAQPPDDIIDKLIDNLSPIKSNPSTTSSENSSQEIIDHVEECFVEKIVAKDAETDREQQYYKMIHNEIYTRNNSPEKQPRLNMVLCSSSEDEQPTITKTTKKQKNIKKLKPRNSTDKLMQGLVKTAMSTNKNNKINENLSQENENKNSSPPNSYTETKKLNEEIDNKINDNIMNSIREKLGFINSLQLSPTPSSSGFKKIKKLPTSKKSKSSTSSDSTVKTRGEIGERSLRPKVVKNYNEKLLFQAKEIENLEAKRRKLLSANTLMRNDYESRNERRINSADADTKRSKDTNLEKQKLKFAQDACSLLIDKHGKKVEQNEKQKAIKKSDEYVKNVKSSENDPPLDESNFYSFKKEARKVKLNDPGCKGVINLPINGKDVDIAKDFPLKISKKSNLREMINTIKKSRTDDLKQEDYVTRDSLLASFNQVDPITENFDANRRKLRSANTLTRSIDVDSAKSRNKRRINTADPDTMKRSKDNNVNVENQKLKFAQGECIDKDGNKVEENEVLDVSRDTKKRKATKKLDRKEYAKNVKSSRNDPSSSGEINSYCFKEKALEVKTKDPGCKGVINLPINGKHVDIECFGKYPRKYHTTEENSDISVGLSISNEYFTSGIIEIVPGGIKKYEYRHGAHMNFFILEGTAEVGIGSSSKILRIGESFFVPDNQPYYILNVSDSQKLSLQFNVFLI